MAVPAQPVRRRRTFATAGTAVPPRTRSGFHRVLRIGFESGVAPLSRAPGARVRLLEIPELRSDPPQTARGSLSAALGHPRDDLFEFAIIPQRCEIPVRVQILAIVVARS